MKTEADSQHDANRFDVIRHYEPARIERELLAQVFEIVSHRPKHRDGHINQESAAKLMCRSLDAVDCKFPRGRVSKNATGRESLEPAA